MNRLALLPLAALALAACNSDPATSPLSVPGAPQRAVTISEQNAPEGTHLQTGTIGCAENAAGGVTCTQFELAGVGNTNATASLVATYQATILCENKGGNIVEVKTQVTTAPTTTGSLSPENGRLLVPTLTVNEPSGALFLAQATCPNPNWMKLIQDPPGVTLLRAEYTLTFAGFSSPYIRVTLP